MRFPVKAAAAVMAAAALAVGCDRKGVAPAASAERYAQQAPAADQARLASLGYAANAKAAPNAPGAAATGSQGLASAFAALKLIREATIAIEVARYDPAASEVGQIAARLGGYVAGSQSSRGGAGRQTGTITIRVPSERFQDALGALHGVGTLRSETVATQDVTKAYADLETRLSTKRETSARLRELLRTRTATLPDVLNAERELARVTEEIEQMEGERRFYDHQVALSTLTLTLSEPQALVEPGVFAPLKEALRDSTEVLTRSLAALIYILVAASPWLALAWITWRIVKAARRRRRAAATAAA